MRLVLLFLICAEAAIGTAQAQLALPVPMAAQSLVHARDGAVYGCGVRLTGGEISALGASSWFDVSFNIFKGGVALAQSIAYEIAPGDRSGEGRPSRVPVQSTWLMPAEGRARLGENSERRESLIYTLFVDDALSLFEATANGDTLVLGIKRWGQRLDSVYSGVPDITRSSRADIADCLSGLAFR